MRKIESLMNQAVTQERNWKLDNTEVIQHHSVSYVYLYDNKIAEIGETWLMLFDGGYKSKTTKSRLNAILEVHGAGERVYQKNLRWFITIKGKEYIFENGIYLD